MSLKSKDIYNEKNAASENGTCGEQKNKEPRRVTLFSCILSVVSITLAAIMITFTLTAVHYKKQLAISSTTSVSDAGYAFDLFSSFVDDHEINAVNKEEMMTAALKAYIDATGDRYAEYYTKEEYDSFSDTAESRREGIGVYYEPCVIRMAGIDEKLLRIVKVVKGSPASVSGLAVGDMIMSVTIGNVTKTVTELDYTGAVEMMRVDAGTEIRLKLLRDKDKLSEHEVVVVCNEYDVPTVEGYIHDIDPTVGVVTITRFAYKTPAEFTNVMNDLIAKGATEFVLDVRDNPGGHLESVHAILCYFLEEGDHTIKREYKKGNESINSVGAISYKGNKELCTVTEEDIGKYRGYRYVVLCNGNTASAGELFVATFMGYDLGTVVGTKTYGKGTSQGTYSLEKWGYKGYLKLTVSKYYSCSSDGTFLNYDGVGLNPDIVVAPLPVGDVQLDKALECFK